MSLASRIWVACVFWSGCYLSHGVERPDASFDAATDAGRDARTSDVPLDAPTARDVPTDVPTDAPRCALDSDDRAETFCTVTSTGDFPAEVPFDLTVRWSACRCDTGRSCSVRVADGLIDVRTESCLVGELCEECSFESLCPVPALPRGTYRLRVDGVDTYDVDALPDPPMRTRRPRCYEVPGAIDDPEIAACSFAWDAQVSPARLCYRSVEDVGTYVRFAFASTCRGCADASAGCSVERNEGRLIVRPHVQVCEPCTGCSCAELCSETPVACRSTALRDGSYAVFVEDESGLRAAGMLEVRDVSGPGPEQCIDL